MKQRRGAAVGLLGEKVQHRNPKLRARRPGVIVRSVHVVTVEYNDLDGYGPYEEECNVFDLERAFPPDCGTCGAVVTHHGKCSQDYTHKLEEE